MTTLTPAAKKDLRNKIIELLYEKAPDSSWFTDEFYDKLLDLIDHEYSLLPTV